MPQAVVYDSITAQANVTVTTAAAIPAVSGLAVILQSDPANTAVIYLGSDTNVTNAGVLAWGALRPGEWRVVPSNSSGDIWAVAASSSKLLVGVAR